MRDPPKLWRIKFLTKKRKKMKLTKIRLWILLTGLLAFTTSCRLFNSEHGDCLDNGPKEKSSVFRLLDKDTKSTLIGAWGTKYDSELVTLLKENGDTANQLRVGGGGKISFFIPDNNNDALGQEVTSMFFLHLPDSQGNPSRDIDTISVTYELENKSGCPDIWYKSFIVKYNDSLYHHGDFTTNFEFLK